MKRINPLVLLIKHQLIAVFILFSSTLLGQDGFTVDVSSGCSPLIVSFTYTGGGNPSNVSWDFGNSNTLNGDPTVDPMLSTPTISYIISGSYTVTLSVTTTSGTVDYTETNLITVFEDPIPNFSSDVVEGCGTFPVAFTDLSEVGDGNIIQWNWDFGDGGSSNNANPTYLYNTTGIFDVSLSVTDVNGCNSVFSMEDYITSVDGVSPEFELSTNTSCTTPTTITVTNLSSGEGNLTYNWDFGNSTTSSLSNPPAATYTDFGFYIISLTLSNDLGCTQTVSQYLNIQNYEVSFEAELNCIPAPTLFTNTADPELNTYEWDFGDPGSGPLQNTSSLENPSHVFSSSGSYTVTLSASLNGDCEVNYSLEIDVLEAEAISYDIEPNFICEYPTAVPIVITNENVDSYSWNVLYSDGNVFASGNETNNILTFDNTLGEETEGNFNLVLSVTYDNGCSAFLLENDFFTLEIPVVNCIIDPINIGEDEVNICEEEEVNGSDFTTFSSGIESYLWDWGDGDFSSSSNSSHTYDDYGNYNVTLTITTPEGCEADTSVAVNVGYHTFPSFIYPDTTVCIEDTVPFIYTGTGDVEEWTWFYNGFLSSHSISPLLYINDIDTVHTITLVTINNGCSDTISEQVAINALGPKAKFLLNNNFYCKEEAPYVSTIVNTSDTTENTIYQWIFEDEYIPSSSEFTPGDIEFLEFGEHDITLITTDTVTGCEYEITNSLRIDNYNIQFADSALSSCNTYYYEGSMSYTDTLPFIELDSLSFHWDFGDGFSSITNFTSNQLAQHSYNAPGNYLMKVYSVNEFGCSDTVSQWVNVHPSPLAAFSTGDDNFCPPFNLLILNESIEGDTTIDQFEYILSASDTNYYYEENPSIFIEEPLLYTLSLNIIDNLGCEGSVTQLLNMHSILIDFYLPEFLCYESEYEIINNTESQYQPLSYYWEFGNGFNSIESNPTITIDETQNDTLLNFITVTDNIGCTRTDSFYIYISIPELIYSFAIDEAACPPIYSDFGIYSPNDILLFEIDYGDGESNTVNNAIDATDISHVYDTPGVYDVEFSVWDEYGCTANIIIDSLVFVPGPWAEFSFTPNSGCPPLEVNFDVTYQENVSEYFWVFGDGYTSPIENPMHIYTLAGTYTPVLLIQDSIDFASGDSIPCIVTIQGEDIIIDGPILNFFVLDDTLCFGDGSEMEIQNLTETLPGFEISSYLWTFGDGSISDEENPEAHLYEAPGFYTISLTVITENGCEYFLEKNNAVYVMPSPQIFPYLEYAPSCPPMTVNFYGDSSQFNDPNLQFNWDFGDGESSIENEPIHIYENEGEYVASLGIIYYDCSFSTNYGETIETFPVPDAIIAASPLFTNGSITGINLANSSEGEDFIEWWVNSSYFSNEQIIDISVQDDSSIVALIATNEQECSDTTWFSMKDFDWEIPNIFTPNGDGVNDYFILELDGFGPCLGLNIFDRWGLKIYENSNYLDDWDGKNQNGKDVVDGTYYFVIDLCNETQIAGYITIAR